VFKTDSERERYHKDNSIAFMAALVMANIAALLAFYLLVFALSE
jgi:hypothetical protein